ncbi:Cthe_2314 family HEPN domain-containing protein [Alkalihalobacterium bogoriense]|uniref:Cthe_2314 family HEPN domain-containing protein n=1 Tax=Alkalihalobacterium bogoriense TaxID=246272 RepID=UPI00047AD5E4|nr:Cthe_2314 family HEPN domain-containing protein [Alkalihalobacterium bogoriense]
MEYTIDNTFELLTQEEWDKYLNLDLFENIKIDPNTFSVEGDHISQLMFSEGLLNYIRQHNNKVGTLKVSYALCRHYFDKGIPDDPWYISPGKNGESIQYMPEFEPKDWLIRFWFSYFAEATYYKLFSIWDSVVGFINEYYQMGHVEDMRFRNNVMKSLKSQREDIGDFMFNILQEQIYKDANMYRTKIVHGATPMDVSFGININRNTEAEVIDRNDDGTLKLTSDGKVVMKKVNASVQVSFGIGDYTTTKTLMDNIDAFSDFSGQKIKQIVDLIKVDPFKV